MPDFSMIALIPARSGSKRVPNKNVRMLDAHPMIAYTIVAALDSNVFDAVVVSTDSEEYAIIAKQYGAEVPFLRPGEHAQDKSPDIDWVKFTLNELQRQGRHFDAFSILRPTSPFRQASTIRRAYAEFSGANIDSLRAVEKCSQHPGKMWVRSGCEIVPLLPINNADNPWHSNQYAALPEVLVQNASLEMAWTRVVFETNTIAGYRIKPFFTNRFEGFDINSPEDWLLAQHYIAESAAILPCVSQKIITV